MSAFMARDNQQKSGAQSTRLSQRSRAGNQFLGELQKLSSGPMRKRARADFEADPDAAEITDRWIDPAVNEGWEQKLDRARTVAERSGTYLYERLLQRYVAEEVYIRGIPAVEERREQFEAFLTSDGLPEIGSLELDPDLKVPDYYDGVEWHLEPDGWDGYDLYGPMFAFVSMPHIFRHGGYAAVNQGDDIVAQRKAVIASLPKKKYGRIYEFGAGGISTLACAHELHPEAELVGSDLSEGAMRMGHITARRLGIPVAFKQRDARDTREPSSSFDAVLSYAVMHEMPHQAGVDALAEAFRILKPGGDIVISDPPPFRAVDPFQAVILDWDTIHRAEPFFSSACSTNWAQILRDIGFVDVEDFPLGESGYPWVTRGSKPTGDGA